MIDIYLSECRASVGVKATSDTCHAEWNGQRYEVKGTHGSIHKLARALVAAGCPDQAWCVTRQETGMQSMSGDSLHAISRWTVAEPDRGSPRLVKFIPRNVDGWKEAAE